MQEVPEKTKESTGGPWQLVGVLPLFDTPRPDSAETIKRALNHGVNVKIMTGNELKFRATYLISHYSITNSSF